MDEKIRIEIKVFNITGKVVKLLKDEMIEPGDHSILWNIDEIGTDLPTGVYFIVVKTSKWEKIKRVFYVR